MKTILSFLSIILFSNLITAQTTAIPDANFEQELIHFGYDSGTPDGTVLTGNIDTITHLSLNGRFITSLTGIEDFTALEFLECYSNQLTNLDVSQNTALILLGCSANQLTSLDVSQNTTLTFLTCGANQLTTLDISQNSALTLLGCGVNQLTDLDISQNTALTSLYCQDNQLTCLNVKNGNNLNFTVFKATNNPDLTCIEVNDVTYSSSNWAQIDAQSSFSTNCNNSCSSTTVGIEEKNFTNLTLYPNPTKGNFTIDLGKTLTDIRTTLTNSLGQVILSKNYTSMDHINLDIDAPKGIYFLQLESDGDVITKKIIKE